MIGHVFTALVTSFGLSLFFWAAFHVFVPIPFFIVSTLCAAAGAAAGIAGGRRIWVTGLATAIIRIAAFILATGGQ